MSTLRVNLIGDASSLNRSLQIATARLDKFGKRATQIGRDLSLRLTLPIGAAAGAAIKMASDMEESTNKVNVAFGDSAKEVRDFAKTTLRSFGIAESSALDMTALFGDMATGMGVSRSEAANLSQRLVGLAGDLASFKNINIEEVTTALSGVFTGETESLKRLGVVMTEVNLEQFRMQQGIQKSVKEMTQQEKIMLRLNYIFGVTENAQGDFARTSEGAANQMRIFQESLKELGAELGEILLPEFNKILTKVNEFIDEFKTLDKGTQESIVQFSLLVAAAPPVIWAIGQITLALKGLSTAITFLTGSSGLPLLKRLLGGIAGIRLGALTAFLTLGGDERRDEARVQQLIRGIKLRNEANKVFAKTNEEANKILNSLNQLPSAKLATPQQAKDQTPAMVVAAEKAAEELDKMLSTDTTLIYALATEEAAVESFGNKVAQVAENITNPLQNLNEKIQEISQVSVNFVMGIGSALSSAFESMLNGENVFKSLANSLGALIKRLVAAAAAAAILSVILGGTNLLKNLGGFQGIFGSLSGLGGFGGGFGAGTPVSTGGLISPNFAGRNTLNVAGQFRIDGQDLVVAVERANNQRSNFTG